MHRVQFPDNQSNYCACVPIAKPKSPEVLFSYRRAVNQHENQTHRIHQSARPALLGVTGESAAHPVLARNISGVLLPQVEIRQYLSRSLFRKTISRRV